MTFVIPYPTIDPVIVEIGPFALRWYALAYIVGILIGWRYILGLAKRLPGSPDRLAIDDFVAWATLGVVLGGRLGYVLFYKPLYYLANPLEVLYVWQGGMSLHGGVLGVIIAIVWFARRRSLSILRLGDLVTAAVPIGLFFGRIANFINGELWGRPSDVPWAMVFPAAGPEPRHPSQLYQAALEGAALFVILNLLTRHPRVQERPGTLAGAFLVFYGLFRIVAELFREPDRHLGFLFAHVTMGQLLSIPMILVGVLLIAKAPRRA